MLSPKRKRSLVWISSVSLGLFAVALLGGSGYTAQQNVHIQNDQADVHHGSRQLLAVPADFVNCTPPAIEQFPQTIFTPEQRSQGAVILHILIAAYMFLALAIACDDYFVPACEKICDVLNLESDVAGATFMAAGSSAPELATSVIGVFIAKDDIGLGAVVGSAVFNIMFVIGICALFAGSVVYLHWWPLFRDCTFYTISILALVWVIYDEYVCWYEALVLLILYVLYIVLMIFNTRIENWIVPKFTCCGNQADEKEELIGINGSSSTVKTSYDGEQSDSDETVKAEKEDEEESVLDFPESCGKRTLWIIALPITLLLFITCPDCRKKRWQRWWFMTFFMSIVWIGLFSYVMVWMITIIGFTFGIPDTLMGMTFIAAGASVPDAIASLLVIRDGYGDMAVSNAVGSNVFDILLCLGLPYFLKSAIVNQGEPVEVFSSGLTYSSITLLSTVLFLLLAVHINGWKLDIKFGVLLMVVYLLFNILAVLYELNVFGTFHPPSCPSVY